jgi:DNA primase catalytic core
MGGVAGEPEAKFGSTNGLQKEVQGAAARVHPVACRSLYAWAGIRTWRSARFTRPRRLGFGVGYYAGSGFLRHRIVFPIHDNEGPLVAYAGRSIDGSEPRYLFPPGFRKSQVVFNLHRAVGEAAECAIVVEGFFDCLRVHQAGYRNVVALMGANLSDAQEKLLRERFQQLVLMLDGDEAGRRASQQVAARLRGKVSLSMVGLPSGRQPDQLSNEEIERILSRAGSALGA